MDSKREALNRQRRMMVSAILSPPTVCLSRCLNGRILLRDVAGSHLPSNQGRCRLCWCEKAGSQATQDQLVRQTVMDMLAQVGLDLALDMVFCPFCLTQLQNLVSLKKEMDVLGERLASMIIGLHNLLSTKTPLPQRLLEEEEDETTQPTPVPLPQVLLSEDEEPTIQPTTFDPLAAAVPNNMDAVPSNSGLPQPESVHIIDLSGNVAMTAADLCLKEMQVSGNKCSIPKDNNIVPNECIKRFVCSQCNKGFQTRRQLTFHSKTHPSAAPKPFTCQICFLPYGDKYILKRHILTHRPEEERPFACPQLNCPRRFITKQNLAFHMNSHLPFRQTSLISMPQTNRHPLTSELGGGSSNPDENVGCGPHSPLSVKHLTDLQINLQPISAPEPLSTQGADKTTETLNPSGNESVVEVQLQCWRKTFVGVNNSGRKRDQLVNAEKKKRQSRRFMCFECNQAFKTQGHLTQHSLVHVNTRAFTCQVCSLQFKRKHHLAHHVATHLPEKDRPLSCPKCPRRFYKKFNLDLHVNSHLPVAERPYACHICPHRFTRKLALTNHVNRHLPPHEQPFLCLDCPRHFPTKTQLKCHARTHLQHNTGITATGRSGQRSSIQVPSMSCQAEDMDAVPLIVHEKVDLEDMYENHQPG